MNLEHTPIKVSKKKKAARTDLNEQIRGKDGNILPE